MKLRKKLAAVLAATMVVTSLPALTMAKSDFALTNGIAIGEKDKEVAAGSLRIEMKDAVDTTGAMFFVNIDNAKWTVPQGVEQTVTPLSGDITVKYTRINDTELQVTVKANADTAKGEFSIPLTTKLNGGDATVSVDGNGTVISDMAPVVFARTSDAKATVTAEDATNIYKEGKVADVKISEPRKGAIKADEKIEVTLNNSDYQFVNVTAANVQLSKGYTGSVEAPVLNADKDSFTFTTGQVSTQAPGEITLKDVQIKLKSGKTAVAGEKITFTVKSNDKNVTTTKVVVAETTGIGNTIKVEKVSEIVAGQKEEVNFTIKENVDDSMLAGRTMEVRFDKGFLSNKEVVKTDDQTVAQIEKEIKDAIYGSVSIDNKAGEAAITITDLIKNDDDRVIGFEFTVADDAISKTEIDEIEFEDLELYMPLNVTGDVKVTAEGRGLGQELSEKVATVKAPVEITSEAMTLKVGLKDQKGGKIEIKETAAGMLEQGKDLIIKIDGKDKGFEFTKEPKIEVKGDLKLDTENVKVSKDGSYITIPVKRASDEASTITITEMSVTTDRTVPEGKYDVTISGGAIQKDCTLENLEISDFIVIGTANTEDLGSNGLKKGTAVFTIGEKSYTMNGTKTEMDAAPYISNGRTMIPVRYIANALGIDNTDIFFANNVVTIIAGNKTISLEIGSKVAKLNGVPVRTMETAPVISGERTFVPVSEIGAILGVDAKWDGEAKTATFENK